MYLFATFQQQLYFASSSSLIVSHTQPSTVGDRAFPVAAARVWNSLCLNTSPLHLRFFAFLSYLKTCLFTIPPAPKYVQCLILIIISVLIPFLTFLELTASSRPSAPPSDSSKCLRFGHWLILCTLNIHLLTYLQHWPFALLICLLVSMTGVCSVARQHVSAPGAWRWISQAGAAVQWTVAPRSVARRRQRRSTAESRWRHWPGWRQHVILADCW